MVDIVEIDPVVISASVQAMRFPAYLVMNPSGERAVSKPDIMDEVVWNGIHDCFSMNQMLRISFSKLTMCMI